VVRRAEDDDDEETSLLGGLMKEDEDEAAEAEKIEAEQQEEDAEIGTLEIDSDGVMLDDEVGSDERQGRQQRTYTLFPAKSYVRYVARLNAKNLWAGPGGKNANSYQTKIADITEQIRAQIIHCREFPKDFQCRNYLIMCVAKRRRLLDRLAWKNLDQYVQIRDALKIRHVYRPEALINRIPELKYPYRDRKQQPGRMKVLKLKKIGRLLQRRLARQISRGADKFKILQTRRKLAKERWATQAKDDVKAYLGGQEPRDFWSYDPTNTRSLDMDTP